MTVSTTTTLLSTTTHPIATGRYAIDPGHSRIGFVARHAMISKVRGAFVDFKGTGRFEADDPVSSRLELTIQAASIDTGNPDRDQHLRSDDFLDVEHFPTLDFVSTDLEELTVGRYRLAGDLTIRGRTRTVVIDFDFTGAAVDPDGLYRIGFEGTAVISRKDWGISWNAGLDAGGVLIGDKVTLELDVSAIRIADG